MIDTSDPTAIAEAMQAPFRREEVKHRISRSGVKNGKPWAKLLAYVDDRAIQQRFDDVFGPGGWQDEYRYIERTQYVRDKTGKIVETLKVMDILCRISCKINGEWISKWDGAPQTAFEATKGGLSDAEKRTAVKWGVRYLYKLEETFAEVARSKSLVTPNYAKVNYKDEQGKWQEMKFFWGAPELPAWALPKGE